MIIPRYNDKSKTITDNYVLINGEVLIYEEDDHYDAVSVCLDSDSDFKALIPEIEFIARNLEKMDIIAQKYSAYRKDTNFAAENNIAYAGFSENEITLTYFGTEVNTEFEVVFVKNKGNVSLKSFGMIKSIPDNWEILEDV